MTAREGCTVCAADLGFLLDIALHAFSVCCLARLFRAGGGKSEAVPQVASCVVG